MDKSDDTAPVWKNIYQIVSGNNSSVTDDTFDSVLILCQKKLINSLLQYKPYTKKSFEEWKKSSKRMSLFSDDEMCSFIHCLSKELNLDVNDAWLIVCNFLIFEYYDKVQELRAIIKYEANVQSFTEHVWYFYSADRMFCLKTLRFIYEKVNDKTYHSHDFFELFHSCVDKKLIWDNLLKVFEDLVNEINKEKASVVSSETLSRWINRNSREQTEVLMLMIHALKYIEVDGSELLKVLKLFMRHGFTRHPVFQSFNIQPRKKDLFDIKCGEIGVLLCVINKYWEKPGIFKDLPRDIEQNLELYLLQGDNSLVYFIWVIFKYTLSEENSDYCNEAMNKLMSKNVFKTFHEVLSNNIFTNCKSGDIVFESTSRLFQKLVSFTADYKELYEQNGIVEIMCDLLKRPKLKAMDFLLPLFNVSLDMFPLFLHQFLNICAALIESGDYYERVMRLLRNIPTFCSELRWAFYGDSVRLDYTSHLFLDNPNEFIIPDGTMAEKCICYGVPFTKFIYKTDFFAVIEQFFRALTRLTRVKASINETMMGYVIDSTKFLTFLVDYYEDFGKNDIFRRIILRLDCSPTTYSEGPLKRFDLFTTYFDFKCKILVEEKFKFTEVYNPAIQKIVLPYINSYSEAHRELTACYTNTNCVLYKFLKDEEITSDHTLLVMYVEFIAKTVEKNLLHKEIQYPGLWFILNIVFPFHQQWTYKDSSQETRILNACISTFVNIFRRHAPDLDRDSLEVSNFCVEKILNDKSTVSNLCAYFMKDKFYLHKLMEQESNWIKGGLLKNLENIRLMLALFLLVFKYKARMKKQFYIDSATTVLAKASSLYLINSYSCTLTVLSCKFLTTLARDESFHLIASLGLDSDQVQRIFLERLRDPMEDQSIKLNILDLICTCIFYQHGMTAALFDVQCSRKWYSEFKKDGMEIDTVADFMVDYLQNIKKSHEYLKSPLQVGVLRVMANLWTCKKQHLIERVTSLDSFWTLLIDPFRRPFVQSPGVYACIMKILCIEFSTALANENSDNKKLSDAIENMLMDSKQLLLLQKYFKSMFTSLDLTEDELNDRELLIKSFAELLVVWSKQTKVKGFSDDETKDLYVELCLDAIKLPLFNVHLLESWLDFTLIIFKNFGIYSKNQTRSRLKKCIEMCTIFQNNYKYMNLKSRKVTLCIIQKMFEDFKEYFESDSNDLICFLEEIGPIVDFEYISLNENSWTDIKSGNHVTGKEHILPWTLIMIFVNNVLQIKNANECAIWFGFRQYLSKIIEYVCNVLQFKETVPLAKLGIYSMTIYINSPLYMDFFNINLQCFFDRLECYLSNSLTGNAKVNIVELKEAWECGILLMKFNQAFVERFQKHSLDVCYTFLTLNDSVMKHIMSIPELTVDLRALDLLMQTLKFYNMILDKWEVEWRRKNNKTFSVMEVGIQKLINACIYICLRPKHISFYYVDIYDSLNQIDQAPNKLMIFIINKLAGILTIAFSCLYKLNVDLLGLFNMNPPEDPPVILIHNDFTVPRFELPIPPNLTYGKLLCLAHFYCKTLNQLYNKKIAKAYEKDQKHTTNETIKKGDSETKNKNTESKSKEDVETGEASKKARANEGNTKDTEEKKTKITGKRKDHEEKSKKVPELSSEKKTEDKRTIERKKLLTKVDLSDNKEEKHYSVYIGLVEHQDPSDNLPNQKLREYLRYAMYEYSGLMDPWIENLEYEEVNKSLELLILFLAQQSLLIIKRDVKENHLPYFKRNLCSELQFFTEFIKKRIGQLFDGPTVHTTVFTVSSHKIERDLIRRYMDYCWKNGLQREVAEKNFMVVFYCWFHNICQIR